MTKEELLDHLALEVLKVAPQSARDAYHVAEDMIERRQEILSKWAMKEAIVEYTNKTFQAAEKIKDLDNEIAMIRSRNHEEMKELESLLGKNIEKAVNERDLVKQEFEKFKSNG